MPAKTPMYLKTTTPKRGKRLRLRDFLSGDMISPPMGEVRHSAHVGPEGEGDMFGDVGFLRGKLDMLPALRGQNGRRTLSMEREYAGSNGSHGFSYNDHHAATGLLKTTVSMPVFISHEQAPPKPPRLHLEDPVAQPPPPMTAPQAPPPAPPPSQPQESQHGPGRNGQTNGHGPRPVSRWDNGGAGGRATSDLDGAFRRLVPSSGSFSEASSEDSVSECCGPLDPRRGLSLDSDAGLSNEDLRSDSPCAAQLLASHAVAATTVAATTTTVAAAATRAPRGSSSGAGVSRSESLAALDLDLGPSILDDVLGIMDRYKAVDDRWEL